MASSSSPAGDLGYVAGENEEKGVFPGESPILGALLPITEENSSWDVVKHVRASSMKPRQKKARKGKIIEVPSGTKEGSSRATRSKVHEQFTRVGPNEFRCKLCVAENPGWTKVVKRNKQSSSTSLWRHLQTWHRRIHDEMSGIKSAEKSVLKMALDAKPRNASRTPYRGITSEATKAQLARLIAVGIQPISITGNEEFIAWSRYCARDHNMWIPCPKTMTAHLEKLYGGMKLELKEVLRKSLGVCLTIDSWTSENHIDLLGVTVHWLDARWELQNRVLTIRHLPNRHDGECMSMVLHGALVEFELVGKVCAITTDNAAANERMMTLLADRIVEANKSFNKDCQILCAAHIINLIVQAGLVKLRMRSKESVDYITDDDLDGGEDDDPMELPFLLDEVIQRLRNLISIIRAQPPLAKQYRELCNIKGVANKNKLLLDCLTRWNSTYKMIKAALEKRDVLKSMALLIDSHGEHLITDEEWLALREFVDILEPFASALDDVCRTCHIPLSSVVGLLQLLVQHLMLTIQRLGTSQPDSGGPCLTWAQRTTIVAACRKMEDKANMYNLRMKNLTVSVACVLDPSVKLAAVDSAKHAEVMSLLRKLTGGVASRENMVDDSSSERMPATVRVNLLDEGRRLLASPTAAAPGAAQTSSNEVDDYVTELLHSTENILHWWRDIGAKKFPSLAKIARAFLAISPTSSPAKRLFSCRKAIVNYEKDSLDDNSIEMLTTLYVWLKIPLPIPPPSKVQADEDVWEDNDDGGDDSRDLQLTMPMPT